MARGNLRLTLSFCVALHRLRVGSVGGHPHAGPVPRHSSAFSSRLCGWPGLGRLRHVTCISPNCACVLSVRVSTAKLRQCLPTAWADGTTAPQPATDRHTGLRRNGAELRSVGCDMRLTLLRLVPRSASSTRRATMKTRTRVVCMLCLTLLSVLQVFADEPIATPEVERPPVSASEERQPRRQDRAG